LKKISNWCETEQFSFLISSLPCEVRITAGGRERHVMLYVASQTLMKTKIQLRDVEADDLPLFFEHQRDPIAVAMVAFDSRDRAAFDEHWAKLLADDSCLKKTILVVSAVSAENPVASAVSAENHVVSAVSAENQVAGNIGSWTAEGKREVGYWIDRAFWGRGVATEALSAFLCLEQTRPLYAEVAKHNVASIRVLQKCGFKLSHSVEEASNDADASHVLLTLTA
jgi:RimJ/RimL family protein N-acetyltransferase